MGHNAERLVVRSAQTLLWGIILVSFFLWAGYNSNRFSRWFAESKFMGDLQDQFVINNTRVAIVPKVGRDTLIMSGSRNFQVVLTWGTTLVVLVATACLMGLRHYLVSLEAPTEQQDGKMTSSSSAFRQRLHQFKIQVRRVLSYQLPPYHFWAWLCGGMSVMDALAVAIWIVLNFVWMYERCMRDFANIEERHAAGKLKVSVIDAKVDSTGTNFGLACVMDIMLFLYPVSRSSFLHWLLGTDFPALIKYHRWSAHGALSMLFLHAMMYHGLYWHQGNWVHHVLHWNNTSSINVLAGLIGWIASLTIWIASTSWVRRRYYNLFYRVHIFGVPTFFLFGIIHWPGIISYYGPGLILYFVDLSSRASQRFFNSSKAICSLVATSNDVLTVELCFDQETKVNATQFLYLKFPTLTGTIRKPFSIAYVRTDRATNIKRVGVHVKALGQYTDQLLHGVDLSLGEVKQVPVVVEGPYGHTETSWRDTEVLVLLAGGIGVTPLLSILEDLVRVRARGYGACPMQVYFVWSARHVGEFALLSPDMLHAACDQSGWMQANLHLTGSDDGSQLTFPSPMKVVSEKGQQLDVAVPLHSRLLHGYDFGYFIHCILACLTFLGAYAGVLVAASWQSNVGRRTKAGLATWRYGLVATVCIPLGAMLPPFLLLTALHTARLLRNKAAKSPSCPSTPSSASSQGGGVNVKVSVKGGGSDDGTGYKLKSLEGGAGSADYLLQRGRPDLAQLLQMVQAKHSSASEISVVVSGPATMTTAATAACQSLNTWGSSPYVHLESLSFLN